MSTSASPDDREAGHGHTEPPVEAEGGGRSGGPAYAWQATSQVGRPERPALSDTTPPPVLGSDALPHAVRRAQSMWYASVTMLMFAVVTMLLTRSSLAANLADLLKQQDSTINVSQLADAASYIVLGALVAVLFVAVPEWGFATLLRRRRHWPRLVLVFVALLHVVIAGVCLLFVPLTGWQGYLLAAVLAASVLVALAAAARPLTPSVTRWIRSRREDEAARYAPAAG